MWVIFGVFLMITGVVDSQYQSPDSCEFNQTCYLVVGHRLELKLLSQEFELDKMIGDNKSTIRVLNYNHNKTVPLNDPRWKFIPDNHTVILNSTVKTDSGDYLLKIRDDGRFISTSTLQLNIKEPVSSVYVRYSCFPERNRTVYCSANGDELQFNWTLTSPLSVDALQQSLSENNKTLQLDGEDIINVTCHVHNNVSRGNKTIIVYSCPGTTTPVLKTTVTTVVNPSPGSSNGTSLTVSTQGTHNHNQTSNSNNQSEQDKYNFFLTMTIIILSLIAVLLLVLAIVAFVVFKRRESTKSKGTSQVGGELVYAQISHGSKNNQTESRPQASSDMEYACVVTRSEQKKKKHNEDEVQYGELVFNTQAKRKQDKIKAEDECVYAQVQQR